MGRYITFDLADNGFLEMIQQIWELPLPPYITQKLSDYERYQTVFAKENGSVASPTAWLHFDHDLLEKLQQKWVILEEVLLHIWVWTFKPVEVENIADHHMHSEYIELQEIVANRLNEYKKQWKNIIAVWTTSLRVLESFSNEHWILEFWKKETSIFIYPWYKWKFVKSLITNFHLPCSTLLMLVSSLAWSDNIKYIYDYAIKNDFRFFSFWDAMWIK
jgi:S-adenosylmethionine:tRNA ribosyltransferase-isomerase